MKVKISTGAERDIVAIGEYIRTDNPRRAETFVDELYAACASLAEQPDRCPIAARRRGRTVRKLGHGNYLIFYVVSADRVDVTQVLHGARDWPRLVRARR